MLQINSMPDHIHIFFGLRPQQAISALIQNMKIESSKWINQQGFCSVPFNWQEGFGAFSYSPSHVDRVIRYIQNQRIHHRKASFPNEYKRMLVNHKISFDERFLFYDPR